MSEIESIKKSIKSGEKTMRAVVESSVNAAEKLNATLNEALAEATVRDRLIKAGVLVKTSTPEEFHQFMASEFAKWSKVRQAAKLDQR